MLSGPKGPCSVLIVSHLSLLVVVLSQDLCLLYLLVVDNGKDGKSEVKKLLNFKDEGYLPEGWKLEHRGRSKCKEIAHF